MIFEGRRGERNEGREREEQQKQAERLSLGGRAEAPEAGTRRVWKNVLGWCMVIDAFRSGTAADTRGATSANTRRFRSVPIQNAPVSTIQQHRGGRRGRYPAGQTRWWCASSAPHTADPRNACEPTSATSVHTDHEHVSIGPIASLQCQDVVCFVLSGSPDLSCPFPLPGPSLACAVGKQAMKAWLHWLCAVGLLLAAACTTTAAVERVCDDLAHNQLPFPYSARIV